MSEFGQLGVLGCTLEGKIWNHATLVFVHNHSNHVGESLAGLAHLLNDYAGVLRWAQWEQKSHVENDSNCFLSTLVEKSTFGKCSIMSRPFCEKYNRRVANRPYKWHEEDSFPPKSFSFYGFLHSQELLAKWVWGWFPNFRSFLYFDLMFWFVWYSIFFGFVVTPNSNKTLSNASNIREEKSFVMGLFILWYWK